MSVQTALVAIKTANTTLNNLIGTKFHPDVLPQNVALPAVRFQVISRTREFTFGQSPEISHARVQVDGYAASSTARSTLADALRGAFIKWTSTTAGGETVQGIRILNETESVEQLDTQTQGWRISMDLMVDIEEP